MTNKKISELPAITSGFVPSTDVIPIVNAGVTKKTTTTNLVNSVGSAAVYALKTTTVNGYPLSSNVTLTNTDVGAQATLVSGTNIKTVNDTTLLGSSNLNIGTSFRNKIRNPKMEVAQRGTSFAASASGTYTLDGWMWNSSGGQVVTVSQQADVMTGSECQNSLRVTVTTANAAPAAGNTAMLEQPIEGYLVRDLLGNPIAIRFEVRSPKTGTHCVCIRNSGFDRTYVLTYTIAAANTWQLVTIPLPGGLISAGTWNWTSGIGARLGFVLMAGSTYQTSAGAWQASSAIATSAQVNCMDTIGNIFAITGVQMERGTTSSSLENRDPATEVLLNQRYFYAPTSPSTSTGWPGMVVGGASVRTSIPLPVQMRATPTLTTTLAGITVNTMAGNFNPTSSGLVANTNIVTGDLVVAGALTTGQAAFVGVNALSLLVSAEL